MIDWSEYEEHFGAARFGRCAEMLRLAIRRARIQRFVRRLNGEPHGMADYIIRHCSARLRKQGWEEA